MTITTWIATHSDGTTCTVATTTADCSHNHTYTAPTEAPGTKGLLITTAGELAIAAFAELEDYQRAVGGYIETVSLDDRHDLIANEEGHAWGLGTARQRRRQLIALEQTPYPKAARDLLLQRIPIGA